MRCWVALVFFFQLPASPLHISEREVVTRSAINAWYHPPLHEHDPPREGHMAIDIGRREFIATLGGATIAWPLGARAQQSASKIPRISIIDPGAIWGDHLRQALRDLGYVEGRNIAIEYRSTEETPDRLVAAATELAQLPVDVIVSFGSQATQAAKQATTTIPIVMVAIGDPIRAGS